MYFDWVILFKINNPIKNSFAQNLILLKEQGAKKLCFTTCKL